MSLITVFAVVFSFASLALVLVSASPLASSSGGVSRSSEHSQQQLQPSEAANVMEVNLYKICLEFPELNACRQFSIGQMEKRKSAYMRFGRSAPDFQGDEEQLVEKRKSAYMRFGKRSGGSFGGGFPLERPMPGLYTLVY